MKKFLLYTLFMACSGYASAQMQMNMPMGRSKKKPVEKPTPVKKAPVKTADERNGYANG